MNLRRRNFRGSAGFTLLELVLVLFIIAVALSVAAPKLRGWSRGRELRDAADQFISVTRYARASAAANCQVYRITIDPQSNTYQLSKRDGQNFIAEGSDLGDVQRLPSGYRLETSAKESVIDFFPSGRTQPAQVKLTAANGESLIINCPSAAEEFALVTTEVAR